FLAELLLDFFAFLAVALDELGAPFAVELQPGFLDGRVEFLLHEALLYFLPVAQYFLFLGREIGPAEEVFLKTFPLLGGELVEGFADIGKLRRRRRLEVLALLFFGSVRFREGRGDDDREGRAEDQLMEASSHT